MRHQFLFLIVLLIISNNLHAQNDKLLDSLPKTKEEYIKSEPFIINTINWLEHTPLNQQVELRKERNAQLIAWITNSPQVSLEIEPYLLPFYSKNLELLAIFMGGYTKYVLENAYSKDIVQCNLAGMKSLVEYYKTGNGTKKDKEIDKLVIIAQNGNLEKWVKDQLGIK